jgi:isopenicillin N synthase-like dioxygenase
MKSSPPAPDGLPVIDVSGAPEEIGPALREAFAGPGMFHAAGHGVDTAGLLRANAAFHALPREQKVPLQTQTFHRGFAPTPPPPDPPIMRDGKPVFPDQSEAFMLMSEGGAASGPLQGQNVWPDLPGFRDDIERGVTALKGLARRTLQALATGLGAPADFFTPAFESPTFFMRLVQYAGREESWPEGMFASSAHRDSGCITVVIQDDVGGLQRIGPDGGWTDVVSPPGTAVVNFGDTLAHWLGEGFLAVLHRVAPPRRLRRSVVFFCDPALDAVLAPLPGTERPRETYLDYLRVRIPGLAA